MIWPVLVVGLGMAMLPASAAADALLLFARISPLGELEVSRNQRYPGWPPFLVASHDSFGASSAPVRTPSRFQRHIAQAAARARIDARLVHAVVAVESSYNARALSPKGAKGLMQLMPATARPYRPGDLLDPEENLRVGTLHLAGLLQRFHGDVRKSVAAYHAGEGAVRRHQGVPPFPDTVAYVGAVLTRYRTATSTPAP